MEVEAYASGESFLAAVLPREPDCLILDIRMPGMTGPELRDRLQASGRQIPIVFITAHAEDEEIAAGKSAIVLHKPFDDQALLAAIEQTVGA